VVALGAVLGVSSLGAQTPRLVNISTRGSVGMGGDVLIGGFIINGTEPKTVMLRALGPTLGREPFNVPGALANPQISLFVGSK
jgi:hypothetical protein